MKQLQPAFLELTDRAPDSNLESRVREIAGRVRDVIGLDKCFVRKMGFSFYVDLHILVVNGDLSVREGHRIAHSNWCSQCSQCWQQSERLARSVSKTTNNREDAATQMKPPSFSTAMTRVIGEQRACRRNLCVIESAQRKTRSKRTRRLQFVPCMGKQVRVVDSGACG
jgi:hypothetical protein